MRRCRITKYVGCKVSAKVVSLFYRHEMCFAQGSWAFFANREYISTERINGENMTDKQMGKLIKEMRKEKNITLHALAWGLCTDSTLSYFEKGKRRLDNLMLHRVFDRIGIEADEFALMVDEEEYAYHEWKEQAFEAVEEKDWDRLEVLLGNKEVALHTAYNEKLQYQIYYKLKGIWQAEKNHNRKAAAGYLKKAISITMPEVFVLDWNKSCIGEQELHLLMLYLYYASKENWLEYSKKVQLYKKLEDYISEKHMESKKMAKLYPKLVCIWLHIEAVSGFEKKVLCEKAIQLLQETRRLHDITEVLRLYIEVLEERQDEMLVFYKKHLENFSDIFQDAGLAYDFQPEVLAGRREKLFLITEYLASERERKGMTQQEVSENICEPETYSRIETGKHTPVKKNMYELMERLGIPWCYYRGELELDSLKAYRMSQEARKLLNRGMREEALVILNKMRSCLDMESNVNVQCVEFQETIAKHGLGIMDAEYAYEKYKELLSMTSELPKKEQFQYYSQMELEIIGYMGNALCEKGQYDEGIEIFEGVLKNQEKSRVKWKFQWHGIDFVIRILADLYFGAERYGESNQIEKFKLIMQLKQFEAISLPQRLDGMADNYEHLGKQYSDKYRALYRQTYYVADFFRFNQVASFVENYYKEKFDVNMEWY